MICLSHWLTSAIILLCAATALALDVTITSDAPGNLFTDDDPPALRISVAGGAPGDIRYFAWDDRGAWGESGSLAASSDGGSVMLRPKFPGRGLYGVEVTARDAAGAESTARATVAIAPAPDPASADSYWGAFTLPDYDRPTPDQARALALSHRRLGVSWVRLNFWVQAFTAVKIEDGVVKAEFDGWKTIAAAMRDQGIHVMGTIAQVPEALSSQPGRTEGNSDAGPLFARVPPRDWGQWEQLVEQMAREFAGTIDAWEIWNEPNIGGRYWAGTPAEFAEMVKRSSAAIRRGNPKAIVVVGGFTTSTAERENGPVFFQGLLDAGIAPAFDVFSSHGFSDDFRRILREAGLADRPVWNTENHELLALSDFRDGVRRSFHFMHRLPNAQLAGHVPLTNPDLTPTEAGLTYATAVKVLGNNPAWVDGRFVETAQVGVLRREDAVMVAVCKPTRRGVAGGSATFTVSPAPGRAITCLDSLGRTLDLSAKGGRITVPLDQIVFIDGAAALALVDLTPPVEPADPPQVIARAADAQIVGPWYAGEMVSIWNQADPGPEGYAVTLPLTVAKPGRYNVYFDGTTCHRLIHPRSISPFIWAIDGGRSRLVDGSLPSLSKVSNDRYLRNQPIKPAELMYLGGDVLLQKLGTVDLTAGRHSIRMELVGRREVPDNAYCLEIGGIILRPATEGVIAQPLALDPPASDAADAKPIPLANPSFEDFTAGRGNLSPKGWSRSVDRTFIGPYPHTDGEVAVNVYPGAGESETLQQDMPQGKITVALGRPPRAGDVLVLSADTRHYWEEGGGAPAAIRLGFSFAPSTHELDLADPHWFAADGAEVGRDFRRVQARHVLTADDIAKSAWAVNLSVVAGETATAAALFDRMTLSIEPGN